MSISQEKFIRSGSLREACNPDLIPNLLICKEAPPMTEIRYREKQFSDWKHFWGFLAKDLRKMVFERPLFETYNLNGFPQYSASNELICKPFFEQKQTHVCPFKDSLRRFIDPYFPRVSKLLKLYIKSEGTFKITKKDFDYYQLTMLDCYGVSSDNDFLALFFFGFADFKYFRSHFLMEKVFKPMTEHDLVDNLNILDYLDVCSPILKPFIAMELFLIQEKDIADAKLSKSNSNSNEED